jgi:hypothetical protein
LDSQTVLVSAATNTGDPHKTSGMTLFDLIVLGSAAVLAASILMIRVPQLIFVRKLSFQEAFSVCWVAWAIYMSSLLVYVGMKFWLNLSSDTNLTAICLAIVILIVVNYYLAIHRIDRNGAAIKSIFAMFSVALLVAGSIRAALFFR